MNEENKTQNKQPEQKQEDKKPEPQVEKQIKKETPEKLKRPKECSVCGKSIKKLWYYREGNYYCGKGCWKKSKKEKGKQEKEKPKEKK